MIRRVCNNIRHVCAALTLLHTPSVSGLPTYVTPPNSSLRFRRISAIKSFTFTSGVLLRCGLTCFFGVFLAAWARCCFLMCSFCFCFLHNALKVGPFVTRIFTISLTCLVICADLLLRTKSVERGKILSLTTKTRGCCPYNRRK